VPAVRSPTKKPVAERRNEILDVTCDVVMERGFGATRVQDVAKRLNVSTGLIHYHFDNKDALLSAAFDHAAQRDLRRLEREVGTDGDAVARLLSVIRLYAPERAEAGWMLWIDAWGEALRNPILRQISQDLDIAWKNHLEAVIVDGVASGEFVCLDPHGAAWRLAALLDGLAVQVIVHDKAVTVDELRSWVLHAAAAELGVDPARFAAAETPRTKRGVNRSGRPRRH
jgi:AcrR family transcriptional regulator